MQLEGNIKMGIYVAKRVLAPSTISHVARTHSLKGHRMPLQPLTQPKSGTEYARKLRIQHMYRIVTPG